MKRPHFQAIYVFSFSEPRECVSERQHPSRSNLSKALQNEGRRASCASEVRQRNVQVKQNVRSIHTGASCASCVRPKNKPPQDPPKPTPNPPKPRPTYLKPTSIVSSATNGQTTKSKPNLFSKLNMVQSPPQSLCKWLHQSKNPKSTQIHFSA